MAPNSSEKYNTAAHFQPAFSYNVTSLVSVKLEEESDVYHNWASLFTVLVKIHDLHHLIVPPKDNTEVAELAALREANPKLWTRLDALVLGWIYTTISPELLNAILIPKDTAAAAWSRLEAMFQDNKVSRATHLEEELSDLQFENFASIDAYCTKIKSLSDRLAAVDTPISNSRLVLKLTAGLPEAYAGTVDIIQNQEPLPSFESCRSRLKLAERTIKNRLAKEGLSRPQSALVSTLDGQQSSSNSRSNYKGNKNNKNSSKKNNKGRGNGQQQRQQQAAPSTPAPATAAPPNWAPWGSWSPQWPPASPCPYPNSGWSTRPPMFSPGQRPTGQGVVGQRHQAHMASYPPPGYTPTDIEAAMHAFSYPEQDGNFYMDTGATSHMTADQDGNQPSEM